MENIFWQQELECCPRSKLQDLQLERLQKTIKHAYENVAFYRRRMQEHGVEPEDIRSLDDLQKLPFTTKEDFRDNYPFDLFAVPLKDIIRFHSSSGTTGKLTVVGYTRRDIQAWSELMARALVSAGATSESIVQNAYGYGLFTGGLGIHYGVELIGASVIPASGGNTDRQVMLMKDFGTDILTCTPSYALYIAEVLAEQGIDPHRDLKLKAGIFGAEPWSENMRAEIEKKLGLMALDIYGLSEVIGPGVAMECPAKSGLHIYEDHFIAEIIDPVTGKTLPAGDQGELVLTSLTKEALPVVRYRTRDITALDTGACSCGRTHLRMRKITGRTDDMLIIRGVNVFPSQIESVLLEIGETEPHYQLIVERHGQMDQLEIRVEVSQGLFSDKVRGLEQLSRKIHRRIESVLGISAAVRLVEPKTIPRSEGKAKRVIDKRKL